jgi:hypothetical protein
MGFAEVTLAVRESTVIASEAWRSNGSRELAPLDGFATLAMTGAAMLVPNPQEKAKAQRGSR